MLNLLAHGSVLHDTAPEPPVDFFDTTDGQLILNLTPFVLLLLILVLMRRLKIKQAWIVSLTLVYLLLVGLLFYRYIPVASIISMVAGFGLSLAWAIAPISKITKHSGKK
jgi:hypothetical protein